MDWTGLVLNPYGLFLTMAGMITTVDTMTDADKDQDIVAMGMGTGHGGHLGGDNFTYSQCTFSTMHCKIL